MQTLVIQYGSSAINSQDALERFARIIAQVNTHGYHCVIIHGGSLQINRWLEKTAIPSHFIDGQRYTDQNALDIVEMTLCAHINKALVRALQKHGVKACGISGEDGGLLRATPIPELGKVGQIEQVNPALIHTLLTSGYQPVIAPLALDADYQALNINADFSAAHIAASLAADHYILMTGAPGILDAGGQRIPQANAVQLLQLGEQGIIHGGMLTKAQSAFIALRGAKSATIIDGTQPENLLQLLAQPDSIGTSITMQ